MKTASVKIICDARPLISFTEILDRFLQIRQRPFDLGNLSFELARIESDLGSAGAGKVFVRLYPSDALLAFAGTIFARDSDFSAIEKVAHA